MIKNLAGGSTFLGTIGLIGSFFFYFQPTVEAVVVTTDSQPNLQQQDNQTNQPEQFQVQIPAEDLPDITDDTDKTSTLKAMAFKATAYCLKGRTASGGGVRRGIVAADPRVLPLGSRIQVNAGSYTGIYTVADTGGAIKGRILDIWVASCSEAIRFGCKSVMVSKLGRNKKG
ncbi:MAG: 3D domain-containing protein [Pyrinomonadaceae bacterium]|nr:3D domain-containing protein [Pyrinomonadaceae bacterium]